MPFNTDSLNSARSRARLALAGSVNLFVANIGSYRIRKRGTYGIMTTLAGNGWQAFSGDGDERRPCSLHLMCCAPESWHGPKQTL